MITDISNEVASEFLRCTFEALDRIGLCYCVARNYEQYPDVITGDVDLVISAADIKIAVSTILKVAETLGWRPFVKYLSLQAAHVGFYCNVYPKRFVLVIEFFAGGAWRGQQFISAERILDMRQRYNCTWKPHPAHEAMISLIHHVLYNTHVPEKYHKKIRTCFDYNSVFFEAELRKPFGHKWATRISEHVRDDEWNALKNEAASIRRLFLWRSLCSRPLHCLRRVTNLLTDVKCKPEGVVISLEASSPSEARQLADAMIGLAVRWHIFIPPNREKIDFSGSEASIVRRVKSIIASGGIAVILNEENNCLPDFSLQHPVVQIDVQRDFAYVSIGEQSPSCVDMQKEPAFSIWDMILKYRSDILL